MPGYDVQTGQLALGVCLDEALARRVGLGGRKVDPLVYEAAFQKNSLNPSPIMLAASPMLVGPDWYAVSATSSAAAMSGTVCTKRAVEIESDGRRNGSVAVA